MKWVPLNVDRKLYSATWFARLYTVKHRVTRSYTATVGFVF